MRDFNSLIIWKKAHELALKVYKLTSNFPKQELFGLSSQMRRCSTSIPTNIAEGCGRNSKLELRRFLTISTDSCSELEYQLLLSQDLGYVNSQLYKELVQLVIDTRRMIYSFIKCLEN